MFKEDIKCKMAKN